MKPFALYCILCIACQPLDNPTVGEPRIYNYSDANDVHSTELIDRALNGLGFKPDDIKGPNKDDLVFIGQYYIAWIDQTGFYGKMNGLWLLNGEPEDQLDFVVKDPSGRPVNMLIVGENGDGAFPSGYKGSEHIEFPNRIPEANDNPDCANKDWCNQYGLNEAGLITNPRIPHWSACNIGSPGFDTKFEPIIVERSSNKLKLIWQGSLVKEADGDGNFDGDECHADYLFSDGIRRNVKLWVGYELFANQRYVVRTQQLYNPTGNPKLIGDMGLIGGFVMTEESSPHPQKKLDFRPEAARLTPAQDLVVGWYRQPFSMSTSTGLTFTVSNIGESDNDDTGGCLCVVHNGIEIGGGLVHAGISLPVDGGKFSVQGRRSLSWSK